MSVLLVLVGDIDFLFLQFNLIRVGGDEGGGEPKMTSILMTAALFDAKLNFHVAVDGITNFNVVRGGLFGHGSRLAFVNLLILANDDNVGIARKIGDGVETKTFQHQQARLRRRTAQVQHLIVIAHVTLLRSDRYTFTVFRTARPVVQHRFVAIQNNLRMHQIATNNQTSTTLTGFTIDSYHVIFIFGKPRVDIRTTLNDQINRRRIVILERITGH